MSSINLTIEIGIYKNGQFNDNALIALVNYSKICNIFDNYFLIFITCVKA